MTAFASNGMTRYMQNSMLIEHAAIFSVVVLKNNLTIESIIVVVNSCNLIYKQPSSTKRLPRGLA
jgi:hypothetical protein